MYLRTLVFVAISFFAVQAVAGDMVVIVNKGNEARVSKELVASYYLGEAKQWLGGRPVAAIDLPLSNPERAAFCRAFLGMDAHQVKTIVSQNTVSGKANPPREVATDDEVKKAVSSSLMAIGYIKASSVDDTVKVVLKE